MLSISQHDILAIVVAASFAAGLNVYATVATLGLLSHTHFFELPPALHLLGSWPVILVCAVLFALEFVGDKIPVFDLLWNALNTFVRGSDLLRGNTASLANGASGGGSSGRSHCSCRAQRQNRSPSRSDALARTVLQRSFEFWRRRRCHRPDLVRHPTPYRREHYRGRVSGSGDSGGALRHSLGAAAFPAGPFQPASKPTEFDLTAPGVRPFAVRCFNNFLTFPGAPPPAWSA